MRDQFPQRAFRELMFPALRGWKQLCAHPPCAAIRYVGMAEFTDQFVRSLDSQHEWIVSQLVRSFASCTLALLGRSREIIILKEILDIVCNKNHAITISLKQTRSIVSLAACTLSKCFYRFVALRWFSAAIFSTVSRLVLSKLFFSAKVGTNIYWKKIMCNIC